ncbi:MAG TPA: zonular occludens toxin domain-containing protein [Alphaproteobacteria bacterium]|nr:zonular occludens toxin domain-containing protein [Alphaproteobacteria bacterium]
MAKKKHESKKSSEKSDKKESDWKIFFKVLWIIISFPFKAVFYIILYVFKGIDWIVKKISERRKINTEKKRDNNPDRIEHYVEFKTIKQNSGSFKNFENTLSKKDSTIGIILGARGSGKSAFGLKLLENLHALNTRKIYAMGFKTNELPAWIHVAETLEDIADGSYVLIDEGGILFNSRQGFSDANQLLSKLLLVARHKDLSIMFISQNSSNLEINAIRQADYLVLKPSSLLQLDFERKKIKEIYEEALEDFKKYKNVKGLTYVYSDSFTGFVTNPLPTFWSTNISKSFRNKKE